MKNTCILCESKKFTTQLEILIPDRFEKALGIKLENYSRKWISCNTCGLFYNLNSDENQKLLNTIGHKYYEIDFGNINLIDRFNKLVELPKDKSDNFHRVNRVKNYFNEQVKKENVEKYKILDIGSGLGIFLDSFISNDWDGTAIEPDPIAYNHIVKISKDRFRVINNVFKKGVIHDKFNLITFNKVLEHLENPITLLEDAKTILMKNMGLIYVEVPDLTTSKFRKEDDNILGSLHFILFDPYTLSLMFKKAGLNTLKVERIVEPSGKITTYGFASI
jgi:SAM-dependent methyltransferase